MEFQYQERFIVELMNAGYEKAAKSFSQLVGKQVRITTSQALVVRNENDDSFFSVGKGEVYVLITQLIGDLTGKSYLVISEEERQAIFSELKFVKERNMGDAFLVEVDNIISASVISEISNALKVEVYGDVPQLFKVEAGSLQNFLRKDLLDSSSSVIYSDTTFHIHNEERVRPRFLWKFNTAIFEMIPANKMAS